MASVRVSWKSSGKPAGNQRVVLSFDGLRGVSSNEITNNSGEAHFNVNSGTGKVIVNGKSVYHGRLEGRVPVYI